MSQAPPHLPTLAPIEAYGNGGFRFAGMSHQGSILCLPSGIYGWPVASLEDISLEAVAPVFAEASQISLLLFGAGSTLARPPKLITAALEKANVGLDPMDTGAACRTFNILLGEQRPVAAALIAVD